MRKRHGINWYRVTCGACGVLMSALGYCGIEDVGLSAMALFVVGNTWTGFVLLDDGFWKRD